MVFFIVSIFGCGEKRETIQAGVSVKNITPPLELNPILGGYGDRMSKPAIGVHDSIYAKAIVFKDDTKTFALVTTDMTEYAVLNQQLQQQHASPTLPNPDKYQKLNQ